MTLIADTVALLEQSRSPHAMIGATALAVLGSSRSTQDLDILTTDCGVLRRSFWSQLESTGADVDVRIGDISDPLVGVVRISRAEDRPVDVIVGEAPWQERVLSEASFHRIGNTRVPVVNAIGLVLLKLYAGGPQDRWDIEQLLAIAPDRQSLTGLINERVADLPPRGRRLWDRMVKSET